MNGKKQHDGFSDLRKLLNMPEADAAPPTTPTRKTGVVKKVLTNFGFINVEGERNDVHFDFRNFVTRINAGQVQEGMKVAFEMGPGKGGKFTAINIEILELPHGRPAAGTPPAAKALTTSGTHYFLPDETRKALEMPLKYQNRGKPEQQIDNFNLLLNKCAYYDEPKDERKEGKFVFYLKDTYELQPAFPAQLVKSVAQQHRAAIQGLHLQLAEIPQVTVDWRLIVGLGNESVYETSMTLHHIYGIPYIPGQAVKGVLRSWFMLECFHADEKQALKCQWFCDIFGCPKKDSVYHEARQGKMYFFDGFPIDLKPEHIQPDIMNPHYSEYYMNGKPPADWQNPVPVNFLTVQGATFEFFVGIKPEANSEIARNEPHFPGHTLLAVIQEQLPLAFSQHGLGAKTAVGYGYFTHE